MDDAQKKLAIETLQEARSLILNCKETRDSSKEVLIPIIEAEVVLRQIEGALTALKK